MLGSVWSGDLVTDPIERIPGYHNVNSDYPHLQSWTSLCTMHNYKAMLLRFGPCRLWLNCWQVSPKVVKIWNQAMIEKESCDQSSISPPCPGIMRSGGELSWLFLGVSHFTVTVLSLADGKLWRVEECYEELKKSLLPTLRLFLPQSLAPAGARVERETIFWHCFTTPHQGYCIGDRSSPVFQFNWYWIVLDLFKVYLHIQ